VPQEIERIARGISSAHNASYEFDIEYGYDMVTNDKELTDMMREMALKVVGSESHIFTPKDPSFGGEDFSAYQNIAPGFFLGLGCGNKARGICESLHSSKFRLDEDCLPIGVAMHVAFIAKQLMA